MASSPFGSYGTVREQICVGDIIGLYKSKLNIDVSKFFGPLKTINLMECEETGLLYFEPIVAGDAFFYEQLQDVEYYYMDERPEFLTAQKYIGSASVLEVGCGVGHFSNYINKAQYIGLELNAKAASQAISKGIDVRNQLLDEYNNNNDPKDVVCSFQVLEHVSDVDGFIKSCIQACKKNGYIIFSLPAEDSFMAKAKNHILNLPPHHITLWPDKVFPHIAKKYHLELIELKHEDMEDMHRLWFFKVMIRNYLAGIFKKENKGKVDLSFSGKALDKISAGLAWIYKKIFAGNLYYPAGHTVTVVFRNSA